MKGVILAGGQGTRLDPLTRVTSKQLLPIYNKPMIYYPLATLMEAGIRDIAIITTPSERGRFESLLQTGEQWGIKLTYLVQSEPKGIAQAFVIGADFIGRDSVMLILGDNIFMGDAFLRGLKREAISHDRGAMIWLYPVDDPSRFGVAKFDTEMNITGIVEKPLEPVSDWAVTGVYLYDNRVVEIARSLKPSARGEYEITDVNNVYIGARQMRFASMTQRGMYWIDAGTPRALLRASLMIESAETEFDRFVGYPELVARREGWINPNAFHAPSRQPDGVYAMRPAGSPSTRR